jgi:hypothetical protein
MLPLLFLPFCLFSLLDEIQKPRQPVEKVFDKLMSKKKDLLHAPGKS